MPRSLSSLSKVVVIAIILSLVHIGVLYYLTVQESEAQITKTEKAIDVLLTNKIKDGALNINAADGDQLLFNFDLITLNIANDKIPVYTNDFTDTSLTHVLFPSEGSVKVNTVKVDFTYVDEEVISSFFLKAILGTIFILLGCFSSSVLASKKVFKALHNIKTSIDNHQYEDIEYGNIGEKLNSNEKKLKQNITEAVKKIEELENASALDPLTGLYNRSAFRQQFDKLLKVRDKKQQNLLAIVRASELQQINSERGFQMGDSYIRDLADIVKEVLSHFQNASSFRISGSDIAIICSKVESPDELINRMNDELKTLVVNYQATQSLTCVCYTGYTTFTSEDNSEAILSRADLALALAQTGPANGFYVQNNNTEDYLQGEIHWRETVLDIINHHAITLFYQPIKSMNISIRSYVEIFARFTSSSGEPLSTETVLAAAQRHDLLVRLEEKIIENIINKFNKVNNRNIRFGINLSANALISTSFLLWLERTLLRNSDIANCLVFEINEELLGSNNVAAQRLFSIIKRAGSFTSISHFGKGIESFRIYRELKPNYIKLDPNLCQSFEKDLTSQQFIRMIIEVSHRLGCVVIAEGIETLLQRQNIENLYVDAMQGYLIAKPTELIDSVEIEFNRPTYQGVGPDVQEYRA